MPAVGTLILQVIRDAKPPKTGLCAAEILRELLGQGYQTDLPAVATFCLELEKRGYVKSALVDMGPYPSRRVYHVARSFVK